ncbi:MAG: NADH-quinone oxidoreductase subunit M, partial [Pseudoxanthomonas sp.]
MSNWPLLSVLIWLPMLGGVLVLALGNDRASAARWTALGVALATFVASIGLLTGMDAANPAMQFAEQHAWVPSYKIGYNLGADGISIALIVLTTLTTALALIGAWTVIEKRVSQYVAAFLFLEGMMIGVFCATDAMLFYV